MSRGLLHCLKKSARPFHILLLLCILGGVASGQETQDCSESRLAECRNVLAQKHELPGFGPVFTQDQIHRTCGALLEADQCVLHMYQSCPELQSLPKPASANTESILELQKCRILIDKYVHKLGCYEPLNSTYQRCLDREQDSFQKNIDRFRDGNKELQQEGCCNIRRIFDCILTPTEQNCDKGAMGIMEDFLHISLPSGMSSLCLQYKCLSQTDVDASASSGKHHPENGHDDHTGSIHSNHSPRRQTSFLSLIGLLCVAFTNVVHKY